uniref:Uncharacterized protein n=1 Tax=Myotis myotis TaxID=51298 RepID=A0A7J7ZXR8_MYOMY|nr:hypothetical protein mMyoMyo1_009587 [Myotis myotis]
MARTTGLPLGPRGKGAQAVEPDTVGSRTASREEQRQTGKLSSSDCRAQGPRNREAPLPLLSGGHRSWCPSWKSGPPSSWKYPGAEAISSPTMPFAPTVPAVPRDLCWPMTLSRSDTCHCQGEAVRSPHSSLSWAAMTMEGSGWCSWEAGLLSAWVPR